MTGWEPLFPGGARVLALPNWESPRLYVSAEGFFERWRTSAFYPASRLRGRAYRLLLRTRAAAGLSAARVARSDGWALGEFARDVLPHAASVAVLAGEPSPVQKMTARLWDSKGRILGYVKYAEEGPARRRLRLEHSVLARLPAGAGPTPLKYGPVANGEALISAPLRGEHPPATLPPPEEVEGFLRRLVVSPPLPLEDHPWARRVRERGGSGVDPWLDALAGRDWPIVVQHGDLAPWNLLRNPEGALAAVDWEYATPESMPYLDLAHYVLQVSFLVLGWSPTKALRFGVECLAERAGLGRGEAGAMMRLAAYDVYLKHLEDGYARDPEVHEWLRAVWEGAA